MSANVPSGTYLAARKVYNIQNIYLRIGDQLTDILSRADLSQLDPSASMSNEAAARLALVTGFQIAESLPDQPASEASHLRMDWKYALHMPLDHPGIRATELCNFRQNLYSSPRGLQEFRTLLHQLKKHGLYPLFSNHSLQPIQSLNALCNISRLFKLYQAMRSSLSMLGAKAPKWLRNNIRPHWYEHYHARGVWEALDPFSFHPMEEALALGKDIRWLVDEIEALEMPGLAGESEIIELERLWEEQFIQSGADIAWQAAGCTNCAIHH